MHWLNYVKNWYQIITDMNNWYSIFTNVNDRISNIQSHVNDSSYHMTCGCKRLDDYISLSLSLKRACRERERVPKKYNRFKYVLETASYVDQRDITQKWKMLE